MTAAPVCPECKTAARLTDGREIYPHRPDLADKPIYVCDGCTGYVGCHPGTTKPLGTPANYELRNARSKLHNLMLDPLWMEAWRDPAYAADREADASGRKRTAQQRIGDIQRCARTRVYEYLADKLGLTREQCHTGEFDLETCRRAWTALKGVSYSEIRAWARERREAA
ncbi:MAG: zinc-finger-containing protein [Bradyrhizobium sp.]|nr:zinc-finger-containing protein [Bradyrhizobium sp.]